MRLRFQNVTAALGRGLLWLAATVIICAVVFGKARFERRARRRVRRPRREIVSASFSALGSPAYTFTLSL